MYKNLNLNKSTDRSTNFSPQLKIRNPSPHQARLNQSMKLKGSFNHRDTDIYLTNL